jgi:integrase
LGLIYEESNAFFWRAYSSVNLNADGAVIIADPDDPSKPLREPNGKLAVRSLSRTANGQPRFKRYLTTTASGKPFRIQQSTKLVDKDDRDHRKKDDLSVLILAKKKQDQIKAWELAAGNGDVDTPNSNLSVTEFFETVYLPYVKANRTPSTYESARSYWTYLKDHFNGSKTLASYQPFMGSQLLLKLKDEGYSANTVKNVRALASAIFAHALGTGHLRLAAGADKKAANPWSAVLKNIKCDPVKKETSAYSPKEIELILAALENVTGRERTSARVAQMIVSLCFWAGLRPSEAAGLDWKDVKFDENYIHVCQVFVSGKLKLTTKTDEARDVPMLPQIRHRLKLWHDDSTGTGLVFQNRSGDAININDLSSRILGPTLKEHGLDWRGLYACRRAYGTELYNHGATLEEIAACMGNSPEVVFENYVKDKSRTAAQGMKKWAAALAGESQPVSDRQDRQDRLLIAREGQ